MRNGGGGLHRMGRAQTESALVGTVIDVAREAVGAGCVGVYRFGPGLTIEHVGVPDRAVDAYLAVSASSPDLLVAHVQSHHDVAHDGRLGSAWRASEVYRQAAQPFGLEHYLVGPLLVGDQLRGVVTAARGPGGGAFSEGELASWAAICVHASTAATRLRYSLGDDEAQPRLTARERSVAELVARGLTNQEIADVLHISSNTVKTIAKAIFAKYGVSRRAELAWRLR